MTDRQPVQKNCRPQRRNIVPVNGGAAIGTAQKNDDEEFDPPVEMMIHDYDDERTLDEEEALEEPQDPQVEVSTLQRESDMPLEQLLAMYGYGDQGADNMQSSSSEMSNHETTPENDEMERVAAEDEVEEKTNHSELQQLYIDHPEKSMDDTVGPARLLRLSRPQSEEDEDYDYIPDEEWRKTIMVGSDFQAAIPEGLCKYDDALPYENDDKLLWNPSPMMEDQIEEFLVKARESLQNNAQGVSVIPTGTHTRDDEQALYLLLQCGYNVEEALRRRRMNAVQPTDTMSLWSEEECTNFENGLRSYGKNFHLIQQNKVRTRSVGELVQFYYLWKKTERHDVFANKARLEKKKYNLHPGITDYMDRFLEEQESGVGTVHRDRSSSPNIHSLIYGDPKRHRVQDSPGETVISATSMSYPVDPLCELASHFDKESMESLVKFAEDGVRNTSASEAGSFAGGAGASSPPAAGTFGSVEMAFSGTTVAAPVVLKAADSEHSSQATESVAQ